MRPRVFILLLAAMLLMLALTAALVVHSVSQQQAAMRKDATRFANHILDATEYELRTQMELLQVLGRSPTLDRAEPDLSAFHEVASRFLKQLPLWSRVILAERDGRQVVNTGVPFGSPLPAVVDRQSLHRVIETKAPVVGDLTGPGLSSWRRA